jgi:hypothetical protein
MNTKILDDVFSEFIRKRDSDKSGRIRCISCGRKIPWQMSDCGHYIDRDHMSTRFSEINNNAQCVPCNRFRDGNTKAYRMGLVRKYGEMAVQELEEKKYQVLKLSQAEINEMVKYYKLKIKEIQL